MEWVEVDMDWIEACPTPGCDSPARTTRRYVLESTDGPVEHSVGGCQDGHIWNCAVSHLEACRVANAR